MKKPNQRGERKEENKMVPRDIDGDVKRKDKKNAVELRLGREDKGAQSMEGPITRHRDRVEPVTLYIRPSG